MARLSMQIKSGTEMSKWPLKGTLGEVTYFKESLTYSNNEVDLDVLIWQEKNL